MKRQCLWLHIWSRVYPRLRWYIRVLYAVGSRYGMKLRYDKAWTKDEKAFKIIFSYAYHPRHCFNRCFASFLYPRGCNTSPSTICTIKYVHSKKMNIWNIQEFVFYDKSASSPGILTIGRNRASTKHVVTVIAIITFETMIFMTF